MSLRSKREYIEALHLRYKRASRGNRTLILNELCATGGYNRKYAIRLLRGYKRFTRPKPRKSVKYQIIKAVEASLKRLDTDYIDLYYPHFPDRRPPSMRRYGPWTIWSGWAR